MNERAGQLYQRANRSLILCKKRLYQAFRRNRTDEPKVLFVGGVQRSGTNMLMDALERSVQTEVFHERNPVAFDNYQLRDIEHLNKLVVNSRAETVVLKCLMESQRLEGLLNEFQTARAVWMFRHYYDVVNSMLKSFKNQSVQVGRIAKDRNGNGWLGEQMSDKTHQMIQRLAEEPIDDPSGAALQWYFRNVRFYEQEFETDERVSLMHYDTLVKNPSVEIGQMFQRNGLRYGPTITKWINARSIGKRHPPQIRADINVICESLYEKLLCTFSKQSSGSV